MHILNRLFHYNFFYIFSVCWTKKSYHICTENKNYNGLSIKKRRKKQQKNLAKIKKIYIIYINRYAYYKIKNKKVNIVDKKIAQERLNRNSGGWVPPEFLSRFLCNFIGYTYSVSNKKERRTIRPPSFKCIPVSKVAYQIHLRG